MSVEKQIAEISARLFRLEQGAEPGNKNLARLRRVQAMI
jgi:DNA-binding MarR family transcriptional regulator